MDWGEEGERAGIGGCGEASSYERMRVYTSWKYFDVKIHPCTYKPSDDSILMLEALRKLGERGFRYDKIVDLGCGSGILALGAYELFNPALLVASDISPYAVATARCNLPPEVHVAQCDGLSCYNTEWDLVILNPPYLPLEPESEEGSCSWWLEISWSGGGRVMSRLLDEALQAGREILLLYSTLSPMNIRELDRVHVEELGSARFFFEELKALLVKLRA